jgi:hypothetical protein
MKIVQRQKQVWEFTCHKCHTILELDETDFAARTIMHGGEEYRHYYIATPCPVCGKLWDSIERVHCKMEFVPVEE